MNFQDVFVEYGCGTHNYQGRVPCPHCMPTQAIPSLQSLEQRFKVEFSVSKELLRDWFAGQAMAGIYANPYWIRLKNKDAAEMAYQTADAMLKAREEVAK